MKVRDKKVNRYKKKYQRLLRTSAGQVKLLEGELQNGFEDEAALNACILDLKAEIQSMQIDATDEEFDALSEKLAAMAQDALQGATEEQVQNAGDKQAAIEKVRPPLQLSH